MDVGADTKGVDTKKEGHAIEALTTDRAVIEEARRLIHIGPLEKALNLARGYSLWPFGFGLACCAIEGLMHTIGPRFDISRFGYEALRSSPRQADVMIVAGTVTKKMAPFVVRLYEQMGQPKWVIAMGSCAISGGPFVDSYYVVAGVDKLVPVDVYVPGCPPRPDAVIHGLLMLRDKVQGRKAVISHA
ncbi:MAG: NADH-quinone oxidoreductase subunit B [Peptococcaceae bacterium]|jgi:NADH-quinone oxidoreductase subunit B|nr:NADH-quinone oxidoreductase subunit B [Peptococcaceae bacterium]